MSHKEKILITGASGFVGSAVARKLVEAGYSVRALVRGASPRAHLAGLDLEFFEGDLRDRKSVERATAGMRYVFHVAADYRLWARDPGEIFASNVEGTRNLMEAAIGRASNASIYTSSVATIALRPDGTAADETTPLREDQGIGAYKRSKIAAERLVEAMVAERGLAGRYRQSLDADWSARCEAHADRPDHRRSRQGAHSGIRRHRAQPRPCGRRGRRPSRGIASWQDRRTLHPRRAGCLIFANVARYPGLVGRRAPRLRLPWRALIPVAYVLPKPWRTSLGANRLRPGTGCIWRNTVCSSHRQRRSGNSDIAQDFIPKGLTMPCAGFATPDTLVPNAMHAIK